MEVRFKNYVLKKKIGSGSFGDVWLGTNITFNTKGINDDTNDKVAIKQEPYDKSNPNKNVYFETKILENLRGQCILTKINANQLGFQNSTNVEQKMNFMLWLLSFQVHPWMILLSFVAESFH